MSISPLHIKSLTEVIDLDLEEIDLLFKNEKDEYFKDLEDLFDSLVGTEIKRIIELQNTFNSTGDYSVSKATVSEFLLQLHNINCPHILKYSILTRECYYLYVFCILLFRYNDTQLKLSKEDFINRIYFRTILRLCTKHFFLCRRMLIKAIKFNYDKLYNQFPEMFDTYVKTYNSNSEIIRYDIFHHFLFNLVTKFNPLEMESVESSYSAIFERIIYYYIRAKTSGLMDSEIDLKFLNVGRTMGASERYQIYEDGLYLSQIQVLCSDSNDLNLIAKQYDKVKNIVLPNELQKLYLFALEKGKYSVTSNKLSLFKVHDQLQDMEGFKHKLPYIYKLLRSIHIKSDTPNLLEYETVFLRETIYTTLYKKFSPIIADNLLTPIIKNISDNLITSLTVGEFIDMVTLTKINISGVNFARQLQLFLETVLSNVGVEANEE